MDWTIGREGRDWVGAECLAKLEQLPGRLDLVKGKLCWSPEERLTLLAGLLENVGLDEVVRLADLRQWQEALAARADAERTSVGVTNAGAPERHWNCRVIESPPSGDETWFEVHEVHYEHGLPSTYSASPATLCWSCGDHPDAGLRRIEQLQEALRKPILKASDFPA